MKILIIGSVASGKTTLSKKLSKKINIKRYEIDLIVHDDKNNYKRTHLEQLKIIKNINKNKDWIIEGTLRNNLDILLEMSDKIIWINNKIIVRDFRIITRFIKQKLKIEKSYYKPNLKMLKSMFKWNKEFNEIEFQKRIKKYRDKLIILYNNKDINKFLKEEKYYSKDEQSKYGVLGIEIKKI